MMEEADISEPAFICVSPQEIVNRIREKGIVVYTATDDIRLLGYQKPHSSLTQIERAHIILQSGNISFNPKLHLFNVIGSGNRPYVVRLFPREMCSCPSSGICYHIIAVKISIGSETTVTKHQKLNLTMFRKRTRIRKDKTSGRKRARKMDVDENQIKIDIPAYFPLDLTPENICSNSNITQERLVDSSSENSNLYSISPVTINPQDAKQEDNSSPFKQSVPHVNILDTKEDNSSQYSHSLFLCDDISETSSTGNMSESEPLNLTYKQGNETHTPTLQYECKKNELARNLLYFHKQKKSYLLNDDTVIGIDESKASQNHCEENEYWLKQYNLLQDHKQMLLSIIGLMIS